MSAMFVARSDVATQRTLPDLYDSDVVIDLFERAAAINLTSPLRQGATIQLPAHGSVLVCGDLHDYAPNFDRILKLADLEKRFDQHLVIHELIHGRHRVDNRDLSVRMLARRPQAWAAYWMKSASLLSVPVQRCSA